ncbi:MAG: TetR/AcrR family transcriptional regulator, partial [Acidimicrobiales bacterium]
GRGGSRSAETLEQLIEAAIETLKTEGFAGSSARAIAERAGSNQGLIFYHFGSVANLLLAALDSVSARRLGHYSEAVGKVDTPRELVNVATDNDCNELDAGYITVLVEMMAGSSSTPGLSSEVAARIGPWKEFARTAIEASLGDSPLGTLLPSEDVAHAIVALYLGLEMLSHLDGDREPAIALFAHAKRLVGLLEALSGSSGKKEST